MKFRKKIFLAGLTVLLLLITTVSTTFAWFSLNDAAWIDDFDLEIQSEDNLLIKHKTIDYKQSLTNKDIVDAINNERTIDKIESLKDISLSSVHSSDGVKFYQLEPAYDEMNRKTVSLVKANLNSYLSFSLSFRIETNNNEGEVHPVYKLKISQNEEVGGVKKTSFTSENQTIKLVNKLVTLNGEMKMDEKITVNPVNALRLSIKSDNSANQSQVHDYIYEITDQNDLGSYACYDEVLNELNLNDDSYKKYSHSVNAAYTYYNKINNNILSPLGYYEQESDKQQALDYVSNLLGKIKYDFNDSIGRFVYDQQTKEYNEVSINFAIWLEGFDADNLIGLDTSKIKCLLSFTLEEEGNV